MFAPLCRRLVVQPQDALSSHKTSLSSTQATQGRQKCFKLLFGVYFRRFWSFEYRPRTLCCDVNESQSQRALLYHKTEASIACCQRTTLKPTIRGRVAGTFRVLAIGNGGTTAQTQYEKEWQGGYPWLLENVPKYWKSERNKGN